MVDPAEASYPSSLDVGPDRVSGQVHLASAATAARAAPPQPTTGVPGGGCRSATVHQDCRVDIRPLSGHTQRAAGRPMGNKTTFVFDLDGTLVDGVYQRVLAWQEALEVGGIELSVWRIHRRIG
jgi:hypothetical protein